jgi:hypothetical protein
MSWALIKGNEVAEVFSGTRSVTIDGVQHPVCIFGPKWSDEERAALGLFPVRGRSQKEHRFRKETGNIVLDKDKKPVRELVDIDLGDARDFIKKDVNAWADGLCKGAMPPKRREIAQMRILQLMLKHGTERQKWPDAKLAKVEADLEAFAYIGKIEDEREKRLAAAGKLDSLEACMDFDVQGDWPAL